MASDWGAPCIEPSWSVERSSSPSWVGLTEAAALYRSLGTVPGWRAHAHATLAAYAFGILVATALDATEDVAALRLLLGPHRGLHVASGAGAVAYFGPSEVWLGVAAGHLGLLDDAVDDLERAVKACAVSRAEGFHAEAQYEPAAVLARRAIRGDLTRARSLVADAARQARELGMRPIAAKGLTNREIAEQMYLSERTAENHVQHILAKRALSNRSQLAVWMTRQE